MPPTSAAQRVISSAIGRPTPLSQVTEAQSRPAGGTSFAKEIADFGHFRLIEAG